MLVIPAIEIRNTLCRRAIAGVPASGGIEVYSNDPVQMALLWRRENAKTLHINDLDGLYKGSSVNVEVISQVVASLDIPVQLLARFHSIDECREWLDRGVYRIFVHDLLFFDPEGVRELVLDYGPSRVCLAAVAREGMIRPILRSFEPMDTVAFVREGEKLGMRRTMFTDRDYEGVLKGPNFQELERLASATDVGVTAVGGVASVEHLWQLQGMRAVGVDSVVIGRAFYENRFPCQKLWRDVEIERLRQKKLEQDDAVSTSPLIRRYNDQQ